MMDKPQKDNDNGNILVVDDTPENLRLLTDSLKDAGYRVRPVPSGAMAISGARRYIPDLILLDINMPEMNGYEVCQELKADELLRDVPVIFISALGDTLDKVKAFGVGGVDYITKPFQFEEVLARIETHLTIRRLQQEREKNIADLQAALEEIKKLSGLLPICANCKNVRDDQGYWKTVETYISDHSDAKFTHGICPECSSKLYPGMKDE